MYKVLIVEDTLAIREEIYDILLMEGYEVFQAENGLIGFELALKEQPDLIVSDILMPELNGFEMFEKLQTNNKTVSIPLIFLSAKAEKEDIRIGMNLGAEDYLTKPTNVDDLLNAVKNKIKKKLIIDQTISAKTGALSKILQSQKNELDNYSHLISHELKSSLRNISDLLTWSQEDRDETNNFQDSTINFQLMEDRIEKMDLLLAKLEHYNNITSATFKNKLVNSNTIVKRIINEIHKPSAVTIKIKNELPTLFVDENMVEKVFKILIGNALNHIDKKTGFIEIACDITQKDYVFSITDNGIGIHEKYHKKIFNMFEAMESTKSAGIGLSMAKKIISHYNGQVYLKSIPNVETTFYFNLPISEVSPVKQRI
ncbi:bacteriophytochrome-like histidine kinase sensor and response regulator [Psychroflexus torquis ATCC 700755]|uniref:histidine kinase n=1 Tax=Psychroflexus torquis (strain ATCC 700755 / CIP 106069 / ACAM 623) TaxID=313595 RepID=K4ISD0_PSYTT|nr:response regulator [Psychroflexus torquis]AFU68390.1 bacteriophytochrome-like histidine kinase sensor and response regulator [Psychroflexus torquis ATCC 700755]